MTVRCKICGYAMRSEQPAPKAPADLMHKMAQHMGAAHRPYAADLSSAVATVQALASTFLLFGYIDIPKNETAMHTAYNENREALFGVLESEPPLKKSAQPDMTTSGDVN